MSPSPHHHIEMRNWGRLFATASAAVFLSTTCYAENASKDVQVNLFSDGSKVPFQIELV